MANLNTRSRAQVTMRLGEHHHPELYSFLLGLSENKRVAYVQNVVFMELIERPRSEEIVLKIKTGNMPGSPQERMTEVLAGLISHFEKSQSGRQPDSKLKVSISTNENKTPAIPLKLSSDEVKVSKSKGRAPEFMPK
jgi:hypothetical protein